MNWTLGKVYLLLILIISIMFTWELYYGAIFIQYFDVPVAVIAFLAVTFLWFLAKKVPLFMTLFLAFLLGYFTWLIGEASFVFLVWGHSSLSSLVFVPMSPFSVYVVLSLMLVNIFSSYSGWKNQVKRIEYTKFSQPVDNFENKVLRYIHEHGMKIRISECAAELKATENEVKIAIQSLENKGLLRID